MCMGVHRSVEVCVTTVCGAQGLRLGVFLNHLSFVAGTQPV